MAEQEMLPVEQCDREAAADNLLGRRSASVIWLARNAEQMRNGESDHSRQVQAFARHRLAATKAADERVAKLEESIKFALMCTPMIRQRYIGLAGMAYKSVIEYDCGDPWEILRAALAEAGGRGG